MLVDVELGVPEVVDVEDEVVVVEEMQDDGRGSGRRSG